METVQLFIWDEIFSPMNEEDETSSAPKVDIKKVLEALGEELNVKASHFFLIIELI